MRKTKAIIIAVAAVFSGLMMALGFNTLDWMTFSHDNPATWYFVWPSKFGMPFWNAYFFGGILPLWAGGFLAGIIVGLVIQTWRKRRTHSG